MQSDNKIKRFQGNSIKQNTRSNQNKNHPHSDPSTSDSEFISIPHTSSWEEGENYELQNYKKFEESQKRDGSVNIVDISLRCPKEVKSLLFDHPPFVPIAICPSEHFRRNLVNCNFLSGEKAYFRNDSKLKMIMEKVYNNISKTVLKNDQKINTLVFTRLGPTDCQNFFQNQRRNPNSEGFIKKENISEVINICRSNIFLLNDIDKNKFIIKKVDAEDFEFTIPGQSIGIRMEYGKPVKIIKNSEETKYVFCNDEIEESENPVEYYRKKFGCDVNVRRMTLYEKKREDRLKFKRNPHYVIEFKSLEEKKKFKGKYRKICGLIIDGSVDYDEQFETLTMKILYDAQRHLTRTAIVEIENWEEIKFAEKVFHAHKLLVSYNKFPEDNRSPTLYVSSLPEHVITNDSLNWMIKRILDENNINFKKISFKRLVYDEFTNKTSFNLKRDPKMVIARRVLLTCKELNLWNGPKFQIYDGSINQILKSNIKFPWLVQHFGSFRSDDAFGGKQYYVNFFDENVSIGEAISEKFINLCINEQKFLQFHEKQLVAARVIPSCRKMIPVPRMVRLANKKKIEEFDLWLRKIPMSFVKEVPKSFKKNFMELIYFRVVEHCDNNSDVFLIGIEGWSVPMVNMHIKTLKSFFTPKVIDCVANNCEHFLFGIGEAFIKNLIKKQNLNVLVDFDRYERKMYFFGDDSMRIIDEIMYIEKYNVFSFKTKINITFIMFNRLFTQFLKLEDLKKIEFLTNSRIDVFKEENFIKFIGSVESYRIFFNFLKNIDYEIFKKYCEIFVFDEQLKRNLLDKNCPICLSQVEEDFYRLEGCGHSYCRKCINRFIRYSIDNFNIPCRCVFPNCQNFIYPQDFKNIILGGSERIKSLDSVKLKQLWSKSIEYLLMTSSSEELQACPSPNCGLILFKSDNSRNIFDECSKCGWKYCPNCLSEKHVGYSCEQYKKIRKDVDISLKIYERSMENNIQKCPTENCKAVIEKERGCNHIQCLFCKIHFCWLCSFNSMSSADIYGHMSNEHGGSGGGWLIENDNIIGIPIDHDFEADVAFQEFLGSEN